MIPSRESSHAIEERGTGKRTCPRFFWPVLRGMVLIVGLCAFISCVEGALFGEEYSTRWLASSIVLIVATFTLLAMAPEPGTLPGIEGEGTARKRTLEWSLVSYFAAINLALNWICAFLWFSRRYPFFSTPVVSVTGLVMLFYAAIALFVGRLTGGNWRTALLVFVFVPFFLGIVVFRFGLFRWVP
jgi:hypothetical protein